MTYNQFANAKNLTSKQRLFIIHYLETWNAVTAAKMAGFKDNYGTLKTYGAKLLKHPLIQKEIEQYIFEKTDTAALSNAATRIVQRRSFTGGYVYLIREPLGRVKIGKAINPSKRFSELNTACPYDLEIFLLISTEDMNALEKTLHSKYSDKQIKGEWFQLDEVDLAEIRITYDTKEETHT